MRLSRLSLPFLALILAWVIPAGAAEAPHSKNEFRPYRVAMTPIQRKVLLTGAGTTTKTTTTIYLTVANSSPWIVPAGFNSLSNTIELIGGGGAAAWAQNAVAFGSAGCGGAYSKGINVSLTPGASIQFNVGVAGAIGASHNTVGGNGGDSWFGGTSFATATVAAKGAGGGKLGVPVAPCNQALATAGIGAVTFSGGIGGPVTTSSNIGPGGAAAGPNGNGGNGGNGSSSAIGGGGGGGCGGGSVGSTTATRTGGTGGNNFLGTGGGLGGTATPTNGSPGTAGGGGGGGGATASAGVQGGARGVGGNGTDWDATHGCGGGAGGAGSGPSQPIGANGAAGGLYGGGGSSNSGGTVDGTPGPGAPGIIRITWQTAAPVFASYFMSPTGNDANPGTIGSPWLTPNHAVNCGDTITAAAGTYSSANLAPGQWGAVSNCPNAGYYVAQLKCAGPFVESCVVNATVGNAIDVDNSNWAVVGWTASNTASATTVDGFCFAARAVTFNKVLHHIAFVNDIANGCTKAGFASFPNLAAAQWGVDQFAVVGAIAFNAASGSISCGSGVSIYEPIVFDNSAGTHIFVAGLFTFGNVDPTNCNAGANSDGNGLIFDDWAHSQITPNTAYTKQGVVEQSMSLGNGAAGFKSLLQTSGQAYFFANTSYGNWQSTVIGGGGELMTQAPTNGFNSISGNIAQANVATSGGSTIYACANISGSNANQIIGGNDCFGVTGNNTFNTGGTNTLTDPVFTSTTVPVAIPAGCATSALTTTCMATTVANFTATAGGAAGLGYQSPGTCKSDPFYPQWLYGVVPNGLINKPCGM